MPRRDRRSEAPTPEAVNCVSLRYQVAQKLHACTEVFEEGRENDRFRDVIDILLVEDLLQDVGLSRVRDACINVFRARDKHRWPPTVTVYESWRTPFAELARAAPRAGFLSIDRRELAAVFAGGFLGAIARYGLGEAFVHDGGGWPWATFIANVVGAFALGYFATRLQERLPLSAYRRPLLATGLCGALTTFSTMQLELLRMLDRSELALAAGYVAASLAAGFAAIVVATDLVRRVRVTA